MRYSILRRCVLSCPFDLNNLNRSTRFYRLIVHLHNKLMVIAFSFWLLLSISVRAQDRESKGELHIYPRATQIGIVANREFKDQKGRVVKVIYLATTITPQTIFAKSCCVSGLVLRQSMTNTVVRLRARATITF